MDLDYLLGEGEARRGLPLTSGPSDEGSATEGPLKIKTERLFGISFYWKIKNYA